MGEGVKPAGPRAVLLSLSRGVGSWLKLAPICASQVQSLRPSHRAKRLLS